MAAVSPAAGNLPAALNSFVGRRRELGEIRRLLGVARLVTLTRAGGVGKTRLALEAAGASRKAFPDGVWVVDLASVRDPSAVAAETAGALRVPDRGARPALDRLTDHLARHRALIVLDNCEHLTDASGGLAKALLSACPELRVLATSRRTPGGTGENVFVVPPLSIPDEAVELLRERAAAVRPDFRVTDGDRAGAAWLCADLDGLPLAIELAAVRLRTLTVEQVVERLEDRFALLTGGCRTTLPRQRGRERLDESGSGDAGDSGEERRLLRRHRDFFLDLAERTASGWFGPGQEEALARMRAEHGNVRVALDVGAHQPDPADAQEALRLATALRFHWCADGYLATAGRWLDEADELDDASVQPYIQGYRGASAAFQGRMAQAVPLYEGALAAHEKAGEEPEQLLWLFQLVIAQIFLGDPRAAEETGRRAVRLAEASGERLYGAYAKWALGYVLWARGDRDEGTALTRAALEILRGFNDYAGTAAALEVFAWSTASLGDHERAAQLLGAVHALTRDIGDCPRLRARRAPGPLRGSGRLRPGPGRLREGPRGGRPARQPGPRRRARPGHRDRVRRRAGGSGGHRAEPAEPPGTAGRRTGRGGHDQPADRRRAGAVAAYGRRPHGQHHDQARLRSPYPGRHVVGGDPGTYRVAAGGYWSA
ncbi:ATP-binding protein [Streptomyces niveiscabiei]